MENDGSPRPGFVRAPSQVVRGNVDPEASPQQHNPDDNASQRVSSFAKDHIGISGATFVAGFTAYNDIATSRGTLALFGMGGLLLITTFMFAVILMMSEMLYASHQAQPSPCMDQYCTVLVVATGTLLIAADTIFVALVNNGTAVFTILLCPVVLMVGILASAERLVDAAQGRELDEMYEAAMKSGSELASFGIKTAFAMQGAIVLGYLKNSSFVGCHPQVDLAIAFFASGVSTVATMATSLPGIVSPSSKARLIEITKLLKYAILASLASMAMVLAIEFLELLFMLSFLPALFADVLYIAVVRPRGGELGGTEPNPVAKTVAAMSFALMAGTYTVHLGHEQYDAHLKACMMVMLATVISSLRQMAFPFNLPRTGICTVIIWAISTILPGVAVVIVVILLVRIFIYLYFKH